MAQGGDGEMIELYVEYAIIVSLMCGWIGYYLLGNKFNLKTKVEK